VPIRRRDLIAALGGTAAWAVAARAQRVERARRVGVLMNFASNDPEAQLRATAFEQGLRDLGWVEGRNISIDYRWTDNANMLRVHAAELVRAAPDVILANGTPVMSALQEQRHSIPIVFTQVTDPVGQGLVANLADPGGNVTGFTTFEFSIGTKWLELLKEVAPRTIRVALVFNPETAPFAELFSRPIEAAAPSFAVQTISVGASAPDEFERMTDEFASVANGGLLVLPGAGTLNHRGTIIALAARHHLPAVYPFRSFAASGGLLSYGVDVANVFQRAASYVDRILKGANPGKLPIQAPNKYELVINLKTANALGLEVPPTLLARADEVIE